MPVYREIEKKRIVLENRKPYKPNVSGLIAKTNIIDLVQTTMRLEGSVLNRNMIEKIFMGEWYEEVPLHDHIKVQYQRQVVSEMNAMLGMGTELSMRTLMELYKVMTEEESEYRRDNPVIYEWDYVPCHPDEIEDKLRLLMNWIACDGKQYGKPNVLETEEMRANPNDFVLRAAYLHNRFLAIYPYSERSTELARLIMYYYLMGKGYPLFVLNFSESEYNTAVAEYLNKGDIKPFYNGLMRSLYNKMDVLLQMTAED